MHALIDVYTVASIFVCFANESSLVPQLSRKASSYVDIKYLLSTIYHAAIYETPSLYLVLKYYQYSSKQY